MNMNGLPITILLYYQMGMYRFLRNLKYPFPPLPVSENLKKRFDFRFRQYTCYGKIILRVLLYFYIFRENIA